MLYTQKPERRFKSVFFASFFAAAMVAAAYAYYSYTFSRFNFINFSEWVFYTGDGTVFEPQDARYLLVFHSSLQGEIDEVLLKVNNSANLPVLVLDLAQTRKPSKENVIHITAGINTLLKAISRFHIRHSPSVLIIERQSGPLYKQASLVESL